MRLNRHTLALILALPLAAGVAHAQAPHTGDAWIDGRLVDIDRYAATYRDAFVDELARYQRAPRELVGPLLSRPDWTPGDVYFACALAMQVARPCRDVVAARDSTPGDDWAAVAGRLGASADAPAYRAIRRGMIDSYGRWGRPVVEPVPAVGAGKPGGAAAGRVDALIPGSTRTC